MKSYYKTIDDIIKEDKASGGKDACPLNISVIPNYMGINLCSVDAISWQKQEDGQLTNLTIHFIPGTDKREE